MRRSCGGAGYPSLHVNVKPILTQDLGHWIRILQTIFKIIYSTSGFMPGTEAQRWNRGGAW